VRLILASASPRRRELLAAAGFEFDVDVADVDERRHAGESPPAYVERVARAKTAVASARHADRPVIGADTVVVVDGDVLGKPGDSAAAEAMLLRLSGRAHEVLTGIAVAWQGSVTAAIERTTVWMRPLTDVEIGWYVASGEPMDKAGAYAIQGLASRFVTRIDGSYTNVVGLPVAALVALLVRAGVPADGFSG
jgi:septum formation protein